MQRAAVEQGEVKGCPQFERRPRCPPTARTRVQAIYKVMHVAASSMTSLSRSGEGAEMRGSVDGGAITGIGTGHAAAAGGEGAGAGGAAGVHVGECAPSTPAHGLVGGQATLRGRVVRDGGVAWPRLGAPAKRRRRKWVDRMEGCGVRWERAATGGRGGGACALTRWRTQRRCGSKRPETTSAPWAAGTSEDGGLCSKLRITWQSAQTFALPRAGPMLPPRPLTSCVNRLGSRR